MKLLKVISNLQQLTSETAAGISLPVDFINSLKDYISNNKGFLLLSPQGTAAYAGLKKLVEKDYQAENEFPLFVPTES